MKKKKQSLLWEVYFKNSSTKSYLFGTMHVKSKRVFSAFEQIASYIDICDAFCLEIDPAVASDDDMRSRMMLPMSQPLSTLLTQKEYVRLDKILSHLGGAPIQQLNYLRPMNLISMISSLIMVEDTDMILDMSLYQYALDNNKRTFGIETKEEHLNILDSLTLDLEIKQLRSIIKHFAPIRKNHHKMMHHYIHGHIDKLYLNGKKSLGKWRKVLLKDRNIKMAKRLVRMTQTEAVFCAVGAGHLYGKHGILRLLKLEGLQVKPVSLSFI